MGVVGIVGLGRMGIPLGENLKDRGYRVLGYDADREARERSERAGIAPCSSLGELCAALAAPRRLVLMVPAGPAVDAVLEEILPFLSAGDLVIDAGNSHFRDSVRREGALAARSIGFLDVGISGGVSGARHGACLTVGGKPELFAQAEPLFRAVAQEGGYLHVGPPGWGHLVKTVHNGIEYGFLQAIGEGLEVVESAARREGVALDLGRLCSVWNHGSIIASRLIADAAEAMRLVRSDPRIGGQVGGGETGRWTRELALELGVAVPALEAALDSRSRSRTAPGFAGRVIAAVRHVFGGHALGG